MNQQYQNWEAILVDDGSTDNTSEILNTWSSRDQRIKTLNRNIEPKGASTCRNIGIEYSSGSFIIFLDADDLLAPFCLGNRVAKMEKDTALDFGVFRMQWFDESLSNLGEEVNKFTTNPLNGFLSHNLPWTICCPIWRRAALQRLGGFNTRYHRLQDVELHTRALIDNYRYHVFKTDPIDCYYRKPTGQSDKQSSGFSKRQLSGFQTYLSEFATKANSHSLVSAGCTKALRKTLMKSINYNIKFVKLGALSFDEGIDFRNTILGTAINKGIINQVDGKIISLYYLGKVNQIVGASRLLNPILNYRKFK